MPFSKLLKKLRDKLRTPSPSPPATPTPSGPQLEHLFHYTNDQGMQGIKSSGIIKRSAHGKYGPGVYFTDLPPLRHVKASISEHCFATVLSGKMYYAVEVYLPRHKLTLQDEQRHIWTFCEDVKLDKFECYLIEWLTEDSMHTCKYPGEQALGKLRSKSKPPVTSQRSAQPSSVASSRRYIKLYYYTDEEGYNRIMSSHVIDVSPGCVGSGVYLSELDPSQPYEDSLRELNVQPDGRICWAIELHLPRHKIRLHHEHLPICYFCECVELQQCQFTFIEIP